MKTKLFSSTVFLLFVFCNSLFADSPITSTDIYSGYKNEPIVAEAINNSILTEKLLEYLVSPQNPIAVKIAVINALGWDINGKNNADVFFQYLNKTNTYKSIADFMQKADGELLICMAYLKVMDDYFDVNEAVSMAQKAKSKSPKSYTVNIVCALIEAQKAMSSDWCEVYQFTDRVRENKSLNDDMNETAKARIFGYMDGYGKYCMPNYFQQAIAYSNQKNYTQAVECYKKILTLNPNDYWANNNIGYNYFLIEKYYSAIPYLQKAIEIEPNNPFAYSNLGGIYLALGDYQKTISYCQKAIDIKDKYNADSKGKSSPFDFGEPYYYVGLAYAGQNDWEKSLSYLIEAARLGDEDARVFLEELDRSSNASQQQRPTQQQQSRPQQNTLKKDPNFKLK